MKTVFFSETIAASDLKVGRSRHLIDFMKVYEYCKSRSFHGNKAQGHVHTKIQTTFSRKLPF